MAHIITTIGKYKIRLANFILFIAPHYQNAYTAKLYSILAILKLVEYLIKSLSKLEQKYYLIDIVSDCAAVLSLLLTSIKIVPILTALH